METTLMGSGFKGLVQKRVLCEGLQNADVAFGGMRGFTTFGGIFS